MLCGASPVSPTRITRLPAKNPINCVSGDQNGRIPPSVPFSGRGSVESSDLTQICVCPDVSSRATKARERPSGDNAPPETSVVPEGGSTVKRIGGKVVALVEGCQILCNVRTNT